MEPRETKFPKGAIGHRVEMYDPPLKRGRPSLSEGGRTKGISLRLPDSTLELLDAWMKKRKSRYFKKDKKTGIISEKGDRSAAMRDILDARLKRGSHG